MATCSHENIEATMSLAQVLNCPPGRAHITMMDLFVAFALVMIAARLMMVIVGLRVADLED
jgi:hypothetical protein